MNREIDDMCTDPIIFVDIENDLKDVERDFSDDPALEAFKAKYEVGVKAGLLVEFRSFHEVQKPQLILFASEGYLLLGSVPRAQKFARERVQTRKKVHRN